MWIRQGDVFGLTALVSQPSLYLASAEAVRDSTALVWDRLKIRFFARRFPQPLENLLPIATYYFYWYVAARAALVSGERSGKTRPRRFWVSGKHRRESSGSVEIDMTNEELASLANITPYTVCSMFSNWQRDGLIRKKRATVLIRSP